MVTAAALAGVSTLTLSTATVGYFIAAAVINLAISYALGRLLAPSVPKSTRGNRGLTTTIRNPIAARRVVYGECVGGGPFIYLDTGGSFSNQNFGNEILSMVVAVSGHPIEDILGVYLNNEYIDISGGGAGSGAGLDVDFYVNSGRFNDPDNPDFAKLIRIIKCDGHGFADKTYVNNELGSKSAQDRSRLDNIGLTNTWVVDDAGATRDSGTGLWTKPSGNFDKLTNCAYVFLELEYHREAFSSIPRIKFHLKGKRVYNPALDPNLVAYGADSSGTHDLNDPDTWEYSNDWTLCTLDYLINNKYGLGAKASTTSPEDVSQNEIDWTEAIASYNISSATISKGIESPNPGAGETEPRYTVNGVFETGSTPLSTMENLLTAGAGELIYSQGLYKIRPGIYRAPATENDIINEDMIVSSLNIKTHTPRANLFNKAAGVYIEPGYDQTNPPDSNNFPLFESSDFPIVDPVDSGGSNPYETIDGEEIIADLDFPFTTSSTMAQRLARIQLERIRRGFTVSFETTLEALKYSVGDTVYLEILNNSKYSNEAFFNRLGLDDTVQTRPDSPFGLYYKQFKILNMEYTENFTISIEMVEESENVYEWNDGYASPDENALISDFVGDNPDDPAIPPSWVVVSPDQTVVETTTGTDIRTELYWTAPVRSSSGSTIDRIYISNYIVQYGIVTNPSATGEARCDKWLMGGTYSVDDYTLDVQGPIPIYNIYIDPTTEYEFRIRSITHSGKRSYWAYYSDDIGSYFTPTVPFGATRYYIKESTGTTIKNSTGTLQIEAIEVTSAGESLLSSGNIRLYEGNSPYNEITVANGYLSPSDGFTGSFDSGDINGNLLVVLSDGQPPGGTVLDSTVLLDITDGEAPLTGYLTSIYGVSYASWDGSPTLPTNPATQFRLFKGSTEVTDDSGADFQVRSPDTENGVTATIDNTPGSTQGEIDLSGTWDGGVADWVFDATYDGVTITQTYTIAYAQEGQPAPQIIMSNPAHSIQVAAGGTEGDHDYTGSGTKLECYVGNQQLVYDSTSPYVDASFRVTSAVGTNISVGTPTENANDITYGNVSNMTANQAYITYTIVVRNRQGDESTVTAVQSFSRANQGAAGEPGWSHNLTFSSSDSNTVAWSSGTVELADGSSYPSIGAGNTGNMTQRTYIYFDSNTPTVLQTSTNPLDAAGATKVMIAVAEDSTADDAYFQVFGGAGGLKIAANEIAANTIVANNMAASFFEGQVFTGGVFQTRKPLSQLSSPYPTTSRTSMSTTGQFQVEKNVNNVDELVFAVTDDGDLSFEGNFLANLDNANIFTADGIQDLRDKLGVIITGTPTGGYISLSNISISGTVPTNTDIVAPSPDFYYETDLEANTLKIGIRDSDTRSQSTNIPYTAPVWDLKFQYSTDGATGWTDVPGGVWTNITGWAQNEYDFEFKEWVNSFGILADREVTWTPTSPFTNNDTIYFRAVSNRTSGSYSNPKLNSITAEEVLKGGSVSNFDDLADVDLTGQATGAVVYKSAGGDWVDLPIGTQGQALTVDSSGIPEWSTIAGGVTNFDDLADVDLTGQATGAVVYKSAGGDWVDLPIGTQGQVLSVDSSGIPEWAAAAGGGISAIVEDTAPQLGADLDTNNFNIDLTDNDQIVFGTGSDLTMMWDGVDFEIEAIAAGSNIRIRDAMHLIFHDSDNSHSADFQHDGTDFALSLSPVVDFSILGGANLALRGGGNLRTYDSDSSDYTDISHNGTNALITTTTGDIHLGSYQFNTNETVDSSKDNYVLTYDNSTGKIGLEAATGGIGGSISDNQVAVGAATSNQIEGSANLTYSGSVLATSSGGGLRGSGGATTPGLLPDSGVQTMGVGAASSAAMTLVVGSQEFMRLTSGVDDIILVKEPLLLLERGAAATAVANYGQLWARTEANGSRLYYSDDTGDDKPVGMAAYNLVANQSSSMTSDTVAQSLINGAWYSDNATAYTLTLEPSTDEEFPVGAQLTVWNEGTGTLTINEGTGTTLYYNSDGTGFTDTVGGMTLAQGGYLTIIRKSASVYLAMGPGGTA